MNHLNVVMSGNNIGMISICLLKTDFLKGYLPYKIITSENSSSEAQVDNFFILQKSYVPFSRYSSLRILKDPMIYQICDVMMSISP